MRIPRLASTVLLLALTTALAARAQSPVTPEAARLAPRPVGHPVLPGIWRLVRDTTRRSPGDLEPLRQVIGNAWSSRSARPFIPPEASTG